MYFSILPHRTKNTSLSSQAVLLRLKQLHDVLPPFAQRLTLFHLLFLEVFYLPLLVQKPYSSRSSFRSAFLPAFCLAAFARSSSISTSRICTPQ